LHKPVGSLWLHRAMQVQLLPTMQNKLNTDTVSVAFYGIAMLHIVY